MDPRIYWFHLGSNSTVTFVLEILQSPSTWTVWVIISQNVQISASVAEYINAWCLIIPAANGSEWQKWFLQKLLSPCCNMEFSVLWSLLVFYSINFCNSSSIIQLPLDTPALCLVCGADESTLCNTTRVTSLPSQQCSGQSYIQHTCNLQHSYTLLPASSIIMKL